MADKEHKKMGRPPLPEGKVKSELYVFRVSPAERYLIGKIPSTVWRDLLVTRAATITGISLADAEASIEGAKHEK